MSSGIDRLKEMLFGLRSGGWLSALVWMALCFAGSAQAQVRTVEDHIKTGYVLSGQHATAKCESCHINGIFRGTPRDCTTCHSEGSRYARSNVVKPVNHLPTQNSCDTCHVTRGFSAARFSHSGVRQGTCATCHNGLNAMGKPPAHMPIAAASTCDNCHQPGGWKPTKWNHTQIVVTGQCATCHTGSYQGAVGKPATATHASVTGNCESCHTSTTSWIGAGGGKPNHSLFTSATNCGACHNGSTATGRPTTHMPIGNATCGTCHNTTGWKPTKWNHTQLVVTGQCATCHTGAYPPADGRPSNHIPYASVTGVSVGNCDTCHKSGYASWAPGYLHSSVTVTSQCATCHTGSYLGAVGKPATATHASVTGNCESCHKSTASWASSGKPDHSLFTVATNCAACHNGSTATGRPVTHVPIGNATCGSCHNTTGWKPTKWNHTQVVVTGQCSTCHTGAYPPADGRPSNHVPYASVSGLVAGNCDTCHKAGYASWNPGKVHGSVSVSTQCSTCHTGAYLGAVGKPATATHSAVTGNCESCHKSTSSWTSGTTFAHSAANAVGTGTCDNCHNGTVAKGKSGTHIPVVAGAAKCDSCHKSQVSFAVSVTMNHSVVTAAACKTCHNGSYLTAGTQGALTKPGNHIPEGQLLNGSAMDCDDCHTGTTLWTSVRMNHSGSQGNGSGWCKSCHQSGTSYLGSMDKKALAHKAKAGVTVTDCSQSGCHRPLGSKGQPYSAWD